LCVKLVVYKNNTRTQFTPVIHCQDHFVADDAEVIAVCLENDVESMQTRYKAQTLLMSKTIVHVVSDVFH
jgi:hypothetical protein